ncbi:MAG: hypothetical protein GEU80_13000 [Dehalococcoidia bacterium]|nr:hypothetical protein [Dehalococcoidia bacterium]
MCSINGRASWGETARRREYARVRATRTAIAVCRHPHNGRPPPAIRPARTGRRGGPAPVYNLRMAAAEPPPSPTTAGPIDGVRVLDVTDARAEIAGRILADLGADVLKVEPPDGTRARHLPPFDTRPAHAGSLYWASVGLGKHSLVLNLAREADRERLRALAEHADILLESSGAGVLAALGLGYDVLSQRNPRLIYLSVSPYGHTGPKASWPAAELTVEAAGGRLALQGDRDRPPLPVGYPQAAFHAGAQAAGDALIALNERDCSGLGQHLDLSMQEVMVWTLMNQPAFPPMMGVDPPGGGDDRRSVPGRHEQSMTRCMDGWVVVTLALDALGRLMPSVLDALDPEASADTFAALRDVRWEDWSTLAHDGSIDQRMLNAVQSALVRFFQTHTKQQLLDWAVSVDLRLAPINTTRDIVGDTHLRARDFWQPAEGGPPSDGYPARPFASHAPRLASAHPPRRSARVARRRRRAGPLSGARRRRPRRPSGSARRSPASRSSTSRGSRLAR